MTKNDESGPISHWHGSADPDPDSDPHQNVMETLESERRQLQQC
jgi:hypothetical protein